jgi:hypothetical protein
VRVRYLERGANLMCDYSLHAMASRPAKVGETLVTTTFPRTPTRGFAAEGEPGVAVCLLPGTELAFEQDVKYDQGWIWTRTTSFRVAKFGVVGPNVPHRHHDAVEFPDGSNVLVTLLTEGQRATVLQLPVVHQISERTNRKAEQHGSTPASATSAVGEVTAMPSGVRR